MTYGDLELAEMRGSSLFDIFYTGKLEDLDGYEDFKKQIESQGSSVDYLSGDNIIRVHRNNRSVPIEVLGRAHMWAHEKHLDHAYG